VSLASRLVNPSWRADPAALRRAVEGRVVVVTGASHGIGREVARQVSAAGARTLLVARSADVLADLARELGPDAGAFPADLSVQSEAGELAAALLGAHGHVDVVVSNAGKSIRRSLDESYGRMHDVTRLNDNNYLGPVRLLLGLLPAMRARRSGHVVNVSTVGVLLPPAPRWASYVASKTAFDRWLRSAATEMADDGVTVSSIYLALVHTRMSAPTSDFSNVPGLTPAQAAAVVARAIAERPAAIAPWWATAAGAASELARRPAARAMQRYGERLT
jgi:NAD(P)-dependent dehydrogenase (short-subunit alcohol dehydrogenase family)